MKQILGLDLGSSSIGWAIVQENDSTQKIVDMGCRIIPLSSDDASQFNQGQTITKMPIVLKNVLNEKGMIDTNCVD